jgi:hypothetical protein
VDLFLIEFSLLSHYVLCCMTHSYFSQIKGAPVTVLYAFLNLSFTDRITCLTDYQLMESLIFLRTLHVFKTLSTPGLLLYDFLTSSVFAAIWFRFLTIQADSVIPNCHMAHTRTQAITDPRERHVWWEIKSSRVSIVVGLSKVNSQLIPSLLH